MSTSWTLVYSMPAFFFRASFLPSFSELLWAQCVKTCHSYCIYVVKFSWLFLAFLIRFGFHSLTTICWFLRTRKGSHPTSSVWSLLASSWKMVVPWATTTSRRNQPSTSFFVSAEAVKQMFLLKTKTWLVLQQQTFPSFISRFKLWQVNKVFGLMEVLWCITDQNLEFNITLWLNLTNGIL